MTALRYAKRLPQVAAAPLVLSAGITGVVLPTVGTVLLVSVLFGTLTLATMTLEKCHRQLETLRADYAALARYSVRTSLTDRDRAQRTGEEHRRLRIIEFPH